MLIYCVRGDTIHGVGGGVSADYISVHAPVGRISRKLFDSSKRREHLTREL